ncbi:MAG: hypothetical protein AMJ38_03140 [Dehalococcoidia bacterium DG_22]|nr:MAG: hypothetical protein AMJ38_03140 [Dehalococcoidia bacterium DG_22]
MFEAKYIVVTEHEDGSRSYQRPFYVLVHWPSVHDSQASLIGELGYRFVRSDVYRPVFYYARPWAFWGLLRLWDKLRQGFWAGMGWLYQHGLIHVNSDPAVRWYWYNLRFGPDPRKKAQR